MSIKNPFSMTFGIEPNNYISRQEVKDKIISEFTSDNPSNYVYLLTGVRGCGKTVLLSNLSEEFKTMKNFIVVDPFNKTNILESIASQLYENKEVKRIFIKRQISFSFHGIALSITGDKPVSSVVALLIEMLDVIKTEGKKVLITIDEADNSPEMKEFVETYQSLLRYKYPVMLLMTGLFENISKLQENKSLTFLYRAPKIFLEPLNKRSLAISYCELLKVDIETAISYATMTKGYAYAYQTLGYLIHQSEEKKLTDSILLEFDRVMYDYVYDKIFSELTQIEKNIVLSMKSNDPIPVSTICQNTELSINKFSVYRDRLIKKGVLFTPSYGYLEFALPRFNEFLMFK